MGDSDIFDADILVLVLVVATLFFGIASKTNVAGYDVSPPPSTTPVVRTQTQHLGALPGVHPTLLKACDAVVDTLGGKLSGPLAPKRLEPERIQALIAEIIRRMHASNKALDIMCTSTDSGTCMADATGSEQYELVWVLYERTTNTAIQVVAGVLAVDDGSILITKLAPVTPSKEELREDQGEIQAANAFRSFAPYSLPISPDI